MTVRDGLGRLDRSRRSGLALGGGLLAVFTVVLLRTTWVSDDAFITLRTVDNLVHGSGLRWNVAERVQSFTHPLWLMLVTLPYAVTREAFYTVAALSLVLSLLTVALLAFRLPAPPSASALAVIAIVLSKAFVDYSTSGLENPLTHLLIVLFVLNLDEARPGPRRLVGLGLLAGLATLNRMDTILLVGPALLAMVARCRRRSGVVLAAAGFLPFLLWEAFSVLYYGIPYPNTALAKLRAGIPVAELAAQGLAYLANSVRTDPVTLGTIALALGAAAACRRLVPAAAALGSLLYLLYVVRIGGDFMSGRFLSTPLVLCVALVLRFGLAPAGPARLGVLLVILLLGCRPLLPAGPLIDAAGVTDERRYHFPTLGVFNGQPGWERPTADMRLRGLELRRSGSAIAIEGGVGVVAYFAGPTVHIVDRLALGDPLLSRLPMVERDPSVDVLAREYRHPRPSRGWRSGHYPRNVPVGYLTTLATGAPRIADPRIARLWDRVALVTRGALWERRRLTAIAAMSADPGVDGLAEVRPPFATFDWGELVTVRPDDPEGYYRRGLLAAQRGQHGPALGDLATAIRLDPRHYLALTTFAESALQLGRAQEARAAAQQAAGLQPRVAAAFDLLGRSAWALGAQAEAVESFRHAASLDVALAPGACASIGQVYMEAGRVADGITWLERATALAPENAWAHVLLGQAWLAQGRTSQALAALERAVILDPGDPGAAVALADAWVGTRQPARAGQVLDRFLSEAPPDATVLFRRGELHAAAGEDVLAIRRWTAAARLGHAGARQALAARGLGW